MMRPYMLCVVGQPEDEVLDRHGAQHAPADVDGRLPGRNEMRTASSLLSVYVTLYLRQTLHVYMYVCIYI